MPYYESPFWMPYTPNIESRWLRAPLPFPGIYVGNSSHNSLGLRASRYPIYQFVATATRNLCGSEHYQRQDTRFRDDDRIDYDADGVATRVPQWVTAADQYNYIFEDVALPDLIDSEGVHTPQWKPVVDFVKTIDEPEGTEYFPGGEVINAERMNYLFEEYNPSGPNKFVDGGEMIRSIAVNHDSLVTNIEAWKGLPSSARRRTDVWGYYGDTVASSQSISGSSCYITAGQWNFTSTLAEDVGVEADWFFVKGWTRPVKIHVPHVARRNAPQVKGAPELYNRGTTEELLLDEITELKWVDQVGKYDPVGTGAFTGMPWKPVSLYGLTAERLVIPKLSEGGCATARLRSADGGSYQISLQLKGRDADDVLFVIRTITCEITPALPSDFNLILSEDEARPTEIILSAAKKLSGEDYLDIDLATPNLISDSPGYGAALLCMVKMRAGNRWGFHAFDLPADTSPMPVNANAYYKRKIFRQSHHAVTAA